MQLLIFIFYILMGLYINFLMKFDRHYLQEWMVLELFEYHTKVPIINLTAKEET